MFKFPIVCIVSTVQFAHSSVRWRIGSFLFANILFVHKHTLLNFPLVKLRFYVSRKETFWMLLAFSQYLNHLKRCYRRQATYVASALTGIPLGVLSGEQRLPVGHMCPLDLHWHF